jgi:O-antigen/teichoic acid export membrane protein
MYWNFVLNSQFVACRGERALFWAGLSGLVFNVSFNLLLISRFGFLACAVITVFTEVVLLLANLWLMREWNVLLLPEHWARLGATTLCVLGFAALWSLFAAPYHWIAIFCLFLGVMLAPLRAVEFSLPRRQRAASAAG